MPSHLNPLYNARSRREFQDASEQYGTSRFSPEMAELYELQRRMIAARNAPQGGATSQPVESRDDIIRRKMLAYNPPPDPNQAPPESIDQWTRIRNYLGEQLTTGQDSPYPIEDARPATPADYAAQGPAYQQQFRDALASEDAPAPPPPAPFSMGAIPELTAQGAQDWENRRAAIERAGQPIDTSPEAQASRRRNRALSEIGAQSPEKAAEVAALLENTRPATIANTIPQSDLPSGADMIALQGLTPIVDAATFLPRIAMKALPGDEPQFSKDYLNMADMRAFTEQVPSRSSVEGAGRLAAGLGGEVGAFFVPGAMPVQKGVASLTSRMAARALPTSSKVLAGARNLGAGVVGFELPHYAETVLGGESHGEEAMNPLGAPFRLVRDVLGDVSGSLEHPGVINVIRNAGYYADMTPESLDLLRRNLAPATILALPMALHKMGDAGKAKSAEIKDAMKSGDPARVQKAISDMDAPMRDQVATTADDLIMLQRTITPPPMPLAPGTQMPQGGRVVRLGEVVGDREAAQMERAGFIAPSDAAQNVPSAEVPPASLTDALNRARQYGPTRPPKPPKPSSEGATDEASARTSQPEGAQGGEATPRLEGAGPPQAARPQQGSRLEALAAGTPINTVNGMTLAARFNEWLESSGRPIVRSQSEFLEWLERPRSDNRGTPEDPNSPSMTEQFLAWAQKNPSTIQPPAPTQSPTAPAPTLTDRMAAMRMNPVPEKPGGFSLTAALRARMVGAEVKPDMSTPTAPTAPAPTSTEARVSPPAETPARKLFREKLASLHARSGKPDINSPTARQNQQAAFAETQKKFPHVKTFFDLDKPAPVAPASASPEPRAAAPAETPPRAKEPWAMRRNQYIEELRNESDVDAGHAADASVLRESRPDYVKGTVVTTIQTKRGPVNIREEDGRNRAFYAESDGKIVGTILGEGVYPDRSGQVSLGVADGWEGLGIGGELQWQLRSRFPFHKSGGLSAGGEKLLGRTHKRFVEEALRAGKPVPPEVLADYPDLAAKYATAKEGRADVQPQKQPWEMTGTELKQLADRLTQEKAAGAQVAQPFQPYHVTKQAYVDYAKLEGRKPAEFAKRHKELVDRALSTGADLVPPEVLADYPDLAAKYAKPQAAKESTPAKEGQAVKPEATQAEGQAAKTLTAQTLELLDAVAERPQAGRKESALRNEFGDAAVDAARQSGQLSGTAQYNGPLSLTLKGREAFGPRPSDWPIVTKRNTDYVVGYVDVTGKTFKPEYAVKEVSKGGRFYQRVEVPIHKWNRYVADTEVLKSPDTAKPTAQRDTKSPPVQTESPKTQPWEMTLDEWRPVDAFKPIAEVEPGRGPTFDISLHTRQFQREMEGVPGVEVYVESGGKVLAAFDRSYSLSDARQEADALMARVEGRDWDSHKQAVVAAINEGKKLRRDVLKDYYNDSDVIKAAEKASKASAAKTEAQSTPARRPGEATVETTPDKKRSFEVDEELVMRSPHTGEDTNVSFRGAVDNNAVVWTGKTQMSVPLDWLRRPGDAPPQEAVVVSPPQRESAPPTADTKPLSKMTKEELAGVVLGSEPTDAMAKFEWRKKLEKLISSNTKGELISRIESDRKNAEKQAAVDAAYDRVFPEVKTALDEAGARWRSKAKEIAAQHGVRGNLMASHSRNEGAHYLSRRIAEKQASLTAAGRPAGKSGESPPVTTPEKSSEAIKADERQASSQAEGPKEGLLTPTPSAQGDTNRPSAQVESTGESKRFGRFSDDVDAIHEAMAGGEKFQLTTHLRSTMLTKPEHIRATASGVQVSEGKNWVTLTDQQVANLKAQAEGAYLRKPLAGLSDKEAAEGVVVHRLDMETDKPITETFRLLTYKGLPDALKGKAESLVSSAAHPSMRKGDISFFVVQPEGGEARITRAIPKHNDPKGQFRDDMLGRLSGAATTFDAKPGNANAEKLLAQKAEYDRRREARAEQVRREQAAENEAMELARKEVSEKTASTKFAKKTFQVPVVDGKPLTITANANGDFAYHRPIGEGGSLETGRGYVVTHIPTGKAVARDVGTAATAKEVAVALDSFMPKGISDETKLMDAIKEKLAAAQFPLSDFAQAAARGDAIKLWQIGKEINSAKRPPEPTGKESVAQPASGETVLRVDELPKYIVDGKASERPPGKSVRATRGSMSASDWSPQAWMRKFAAVVPGFKKNPVFVEKDGKLFYDDRQGGTYRIEPTWLGITRPLNKGEVVRVDFSKGDAATPAATPSAPPPGKGLITDASEAARVEAAKEVIKKAVKDSQSRLGTLGGTLEPYFNKEFARAVGDLASIYTKAVMRQGYAQLLEYTEAAFGRFKEFLATHLPEHADVLGQVQGGKFLRRVWARAVASQRDLKNLGVAEKKAQWRAREAFVTGEQVERGRVSLRKAMSEARKDAKKPMISLELTHGLTPQMVNRIKGEDRADALRAMNEVANPLGEIGGVSEAIAALEKAGGKVRNLTPQQIDTLASVAEAFSKVSENARALHKDGKILDVNEFAVEGAGDVMKDKPFDLDRRPLTSRIMQKLRLKKKDSGDPFQTDAGLRENAMGILRYIHDGASEPYQMIENFFGRDSKVYDWFFNSKEGVRAGDTLSKEAEMRARDPVEKVLVDLGMNRETEEAKFRTEKRKFKAGSQELTLTGSEALDLYNHLRASGGNGKRIEENGFKLFTERNRKGKIELTGQDAQAFVDNVPENIRVLSDAMMESGRTLHGYWARMYERIFGVRAGDRGPNYWSIMTDTSMRRSLETTLDKYLPTGDLVDSPFTKERAEMTGEPMLITDGLAKWRSMVTQQSRYAGLAEPLLKMRAIINHPDVRDALVRKYGQKVLDKFNTMLEIQSGFRERMGGPEVAGVNKWIKDKTTSVTGPLLAGSLRAQVMSNVTGALQYMKEVDARDFNTAAYGLAKDIAAGRYGALREALKENGYLHNRLDTPTRRLLTPTEWRGLDPTEHKMIEVLNRMSEWVGKNFAGRGDDLNTVLAYKIAEAKAAREGKNPSRAELLTEAEKLVRLTQNPSSLLDMSVSAVDARKTWWGSMYFFIQNGALKARSSLERSIHKGGTEAVKGIALAGLETLGGRIAQTAQWAATALPFMADNDKRKDPGRVAESNLAQAVAEVVDLIVPGAGIAVRQAHAASRYNKAPNFSPLADVQQAMVQVGGTAWGGVAEAMGLRKESKTPTSQKLYKATLELLRAMAPFYKIPPQFMTPLREAMREKPPRKPIR